MKEGTILKVQSRLIQPVSACEGKSFTPRATSIFVDRTRTITAVSAASLGLRQSIIRSGKMMEMRIS